MRLSPTRRDAIAALVGVPALSAALASCRREIAEGPRFSGAIVGGDAALAHRVRGGELLSRPVARRERVGVAILGAGVSGLSAAWTLARAGVSDFRIYELEREPGGTALSGENEVSRYPWAAHYVPVPVSSNRALEALLEEVGAVVGRDAAGRPEWAEEVLCREPEERIFFRGSWYEGLVPLVGASRDDRAELQRFTADAERFASFRDAAGRRAFALPRRLSSDDAAFTALDRVSMADWLASKGYRSPLLSWYVEYGCRDDFGSSLAETSAWAGLHYFAARLTGESAGEEPAAFLTWPEGNGRLVRQLAKAAAGRVVTSALVFDVVPAAGGRGTARVRYLDASRGADDGAGEVVEIEADDVVFALPKLTAAHLLAPWRKAPPAFLREFEYAPWLVANLTLRDRPKERGFPMAWDNVLYDSRSLGYVVATHQAGRERGPTVLTYYLPFAGQEPRVARASLLAASWEELASAVVADLSAAHPDLAGLVTRLDVYRWGHAMARPRPGFLFSEARARAAEPLGNVRFAHADLSGLPLVEEAQDAGVRAAEAILARRGRPFAPLSSNA